MPEKISAIDELVDSLKRLPGIGPKAAHRIAFSLLANERADALRLGHALLVAVERVHRCPKCNTLTDRELCATCESRERDDRLLCVVETSADMLVVEQSMAWTGRYFVLMGRISPLNGVGPHELELDKLVHRVNDGVVQEVVIATSFTAEGEATAHAIRELIERHAPTCRVSRIAKGIPAGAELEYTDINTVAQAMLNRRVGSDV